MDTPEIVMLTRDVNAILVPFGNSSLLTKGTEVTITQALGGTYTVTAQGSMYRINSKDADALGKAEQAFNLSDTANPSLEEKIWAQLRLCYDPEIPINIVDLGLVYGIDITPTENNKYNINIRMTLTAPGCGMGPIIAEDAKQNVLYLPEANEVNVEMVFDPPWDRSMLSDQAKLELGLF